MRHLLAAAFAVLTIAPAAHATDIGVTVEISQPGVYGRIDIGFRSLPSSFRSL
jgi:hypothetical protein